MEKSATTVEEQLSILESRGLRIENINKAKEILRDIGYYRLGFYLFPFEKTYPELKNRTHEYKEGAVFEDAVNLYYFDFDLRLILMRYLNRIEISFRTELIYYLSNKYKDNVIWFADKSVINRHYLDDFEKKVYTNDFRKIPVIHRHHRKYPNDRFAPAWKTMEFMTFGAILKLYEQLNSCAHGLLLYDFRLPQAIRRGPADYDPADRNNIIGSIRVIKYVIEQISANRANDMCREIKDIYNRLCKHSPKLKVLIPDFSKI